MKTKHKIVDEILFKVGIKYSRKELQKLTKNELEQLLEKLTE